MVECGEWLGLESIVTHYLPC